MRKPPHPLEEALRARVRLLATTLRPSTVEHYDQTVRLFMNYLREAFPEVRRASQLRRDPHMLRWFEYLWVHRGNYSGKPWSRSTRGACLIRLRKLLELLADHAFPPRPGLVRGQDIPRPDQVLPRPLTPEDDERLVAELRRRNDLFSNALLLTRWTGMRIGETADLSSDCLRCLGGDQWAVHVPIGKLHNDRLVPVDEQVREVIARLEFFRTLPGPVGAPAPPEFLLLRPKGRDVLCSQLRAHLSSAAAQAGITAHIVPHQMRHYLPFRIMSRRCLVAFIFGRFTRSRADIEIGFSAPCGGQKADVELYHRQRNSSLATCPKAHLRRSCDLNVTRRADHYEPTGRPSLLSEQPATGTRLCRVNFRGPRMIRPKIIDPKCRTGPLPDIIRKGR
jgi:integrase